MSAVALQPPVRQTHVGVHRTTGSARRLFGLALPLLLLSLGGAMAALIGQVPAWALLAFVACALWRAFAERRQLVLPSLLIRLLVFLPMIGGVLFTYGTHVGADSLLAFLVALLSLKVLELRTPRDFTVVSVLGFFMTLSAFFYNQSLALALYLAFMLLANMVALIACHGSADAAWIRWAPIRLGFMISLQALPLVVVLFIVFPRVQGSFLLRLSNSSKGLTGMSDHLQPGSVGSLIQSDEIAFRAQLTGGKTLAPSQLYWRGLTLEIGESPLSWRSIETGPVPSRPAAAGNATSRVEQRITIMPQGERWLFALDRPVEIKPAPGLNAQLTTSEVLRSQSTILSKVIYTVVSDVGPNASLPLSPARRRLYSKTPPDVSERVVAMVRGWRDTGHTDENVVHAALQFLSSGGFTYSLNPGPLPPNNALDYFLFHSRSGFCEHYAAAFSTLMRAAGIPSRIVVGYQGGEYNTWGKYYTVRQSDAHAWSEVWLEGRGWQREDPTAVVAPDRVSYGAENYAELATASLDGESRLERLKRIKAPSSLRWIGHNILAAWDSADQQWNLTVLNYDQEQQFTILQQFGLGDLDLFGGTMMTLAVVFALIGTVALTIKLLDQPRSRTTDAARHAYERFCRRIARVAKVTRTQTEGPLDYARRASEALPGSATEIQRITELYVSARYAPAGATRETLLHLATAIRNFRPTPVTP